MILKQHQNIKDRHNAFKFTMEQWTKIIKNNSKIKERDLFDSFLFLMDNMKDELLISLNTIPERIVILYQNRIVYKSSYFTDSIAEMEVIEQQLKIFANRSI